MNQQFWNVCIDIECNSKEIMDKSPCHRYKDPYKNTCLFSAFYEAGFVQNILGTIYISFDLESRCKAHFTAGDLRPNEVNVFSQSHTNSKSWGWDANSCF